MARLSRISPAGIPVHLIKRALFAHHVEGDLLTEIRSGVNKGMAVGNDRFKDESEMLTGRRLKPGNVGRPVGWRKEKRAQ